MDWFEVKWERNYTQFAKFHDRLSNSSNNYTVTGLKDYDNASYTVTITAYNGVGSSTSSNMNFLANFASGVPPPTGGGGGSGDDESEGIDEGLIAGVVVAGVVILAIAAVVLGVLIYLHKSKSKRKSKKPVYS